MIYPVIDNIKTNSKEKYIDTLMWNSKANEQMWKYYIDKNPYDSPFNYKTSALTFIETCEFDCLHDETVVYYNHLKNGNNDIILNETTRIVHGYDILYKTKIAKENISKRIDFINKYK